MKNARSDKRMKNTSKFISLILRHKPETIGISLDEHGWADVQDLIDGINCSGGHFLDMEKLEEIVRADEKQRYSFNEDYTLIQANQGCGHPVDDPAKQEHRPSRETRPAPQRTVVCPSFLGYGNGEKGRKQAWETGDL